MVSTLASNNASLYALHWCLADHFGQFIGYPFVIPSGILEGALGSPQLGEYSSTALRYQDHDPGHSMLHMQQDSGDSILYNYKSLDG